MVRNIFIISSVILIIGLSSLYFIWKPAITILLILSPLLVIGFWDVFQTKHTIRRNFPLIGNLRYILESIRPEIMQYFVETDTEGRPFNRIKRSIVYQRAKNVNDTSAFGTQENTYKIGYEWINHSLYPTNAHDISDQTRVVIGGSRCKQPYNSSILNISAMSFGSLSDRAIMALNLGAKIGNFAHNTGEGGVSPYHLKNGGDLIWQVGTGYFGCRADDGNFSAEKFEATACHPNIKMIEIKLSQGAKPGHGGILPAKKNTPEIAEIRGVKAHTDVLSPPGHRAFNDPISFMNFIQELRDLSEGKPIGFKLCIGKKEEFIDLCKAMVQTDIKPDYIVVDGAEGGTGAAPVEFSDSVGTPYQDGLTFVNDTLVDFGLRDEIKLGASGKITTGFDIIKAMAMGADFCNSARGMMMAIGCIQALQCNNNTCPTGVATQNKSLIKGINIDDKAIRTKNFHNKTTHSFVELMCAAGLKDKNQISRKLINRRVSNNHVMTYEEIYPSHNVALTSS